MKKILLLITVFVNTSLFAQDGLFETYYSNGNIQSQVYYIKDVIDGTARWYYSNGVLKEESNYMLGKLHGWIRTFYDNGAPKDEIPITDGRKDGIVKEFYDNGGLKKLLIYEDGILKERREYKYDSTLKPPVLLADNNQSSAITDLYKSNESSYAQETTQKTENRKNTKKVNKDILGIASPSKQDIVSDDEVPYSITVDVYPEPIGGFELIQKKAGYPSTAKAAKVQGEVIVWALINENGRVEETNVEKSLGYGCDEAAMKAVNTTLFRPGKVGKDYVKVLLKIPITFKPKN